jgi:anti-sigma regulatory factor (Ser/Thr protein kinase)
LVLHLAVEELFTNMVKYNAARQPAGRGGIAVEKDCVRVDLVDPDTDPSIHPALRRWTPPHRPPSGSAAGWDCTLSGRWRTGWTTTTGTGP